MWILAKFSVLSRKGPAVFKFRKRESGKILCCVHLLHKGGALNEDVSCCSRAATAKKWTKKPTSCCFADINLLLFSPFLLLSPSSLLKLPFNVIKKFAAMVTDVTLLLSIAVLDHNKTCWLQVTLLSIGYVSHYTQIRGRVLIDRGIWSPGWSRLQTKNRTSGTTAVLEFQAIK